MAENGLKMHWRITFGNVMYCSTLQLWVGYLIYFKFTPVLCSFNGCSLVQLKKKIGKRNKQAGY